jgi:hypothetical protein
MVGADLVQEGAMLEVVVDEVGGAGDTEGHSLAD